MRWRSLSLLVAVLAVAYYVLETRGTLLGSSTDRLFQAEAKDVERIAITRGDTVIVLKREGEGWRLVEPMQAAADGEEVESLLQILLDAREERRIEEAPTRLADYGLEHPAIHLSVTLKGGNTFPTLLLGDVNPNGRSVYAKRADQPVVFLVTVIARVRADRKPDDFRDKTLLALEPNQVTRVELAGAGQPISLRRVAGKGWEISKPIKARADAAVIGELLWKLKDTRTTAFVGSGPDTKRRYGLERPDLVMELTDANGMKRLLLKRATDPQVGLYALVEPGDNVVTLDAGLFTDLSKSPLDLRDRNLFRFDATQVQTVHLRRSGRSFTLTREGEGWKLTAPIQADAQPGKVSELLASLRGLRYVELIQTNGDDLNRYGLKAPQAEVELDMQDGSRLPVLLIGKAEKDRLYAKLAADPAVYAIDAQFLAGLPRGPDALKQEITPTTNQ